MDGEAERRCRVCVVAKSVAEYGIVNFGVL